MPLGLIYALKVNIHFRLLYVIMCFRVMAWLGF
jgi:hypothetical protein